MKKLFITGAIILSGLTSVFAQSADELVEQYIENIGGREAWDKVEGMQMNAKVAVQGMNLPVEMINLKDGRMAIQFEFQGKKLTQQAFDGENMWSTNFMTMKAEKSESEDLENYKRSMKEFPGALFNYKDLGYTLELMNEGEKEVVEGVECYKLKLTKNPQLVDGEEVDNVEYYFLDAESMVPIVVEAEIKGGPMAGQISQTVFSDYQEVDDVYVAFSMTQKLKDGDGQEIQMESIVLNPEVDDSYFAFPAE